LHESVENDRALRLLLWLHLTKEPQGSGSIFLHGSATPCPRRTKLDCSRATARRHDQDRAAHRRPQTGPKPPLKQSAELIESQMTRHVAAVNAPKVESAPPRGKEQRAEADQAGRPAIQFSSCRESEGKILSPLPQTHGSCQRVADSPIAFNFSTPLPFVLFQEASFARHPRRLDAGLFACRRRGHRRIVFSRCALFFPWHRRLGLTFRTRARVRIKLIPRRVTAFATIRFRFTSAVRTPLFNLLEIMSRLFRTSHIAFDDSSFAWLKSTPDCRLEGPSFISRTVCIPAVWPGDIVTTSHNDSGPTGSTPCWLCSSRAQGVPDLRAQEPLQTGKERRITRWSMSTLLQAVQRRLDEIAGLRHPRDGEHPFGTIKARMGANALPDETLPRVATEMAAARACLQSDTRHEHHGCQTTPAGMRHSRQRDAPSPVAEPPKIAGIRTGALPDRSR